jgi:hypothetical protein
VEPTTFRIDEGEFRAWHAAVQARMSVRGGAALAAEMDSHLQRKLEAGHVLVARHQLFAWSEALQGMAQRDPQGASVGNLLSLRQVADDMRAVLGGGVSAPAARSEAPRRFEPAAAPASAPFTFSAPGAPVGSLGNAALAALPQRFVSPAELGDAVRQLIRAAKGEVLVVSPWAYGLETLVDELTRVPSGVRVRVLSRRPEREDDVHRTAMERLKKKQVEGAFSTMLQTRMVIVDGARVCLGAASIPLSGAPTREAALMTSDADVVRQARAHFDRVYAEAQAPAR